jgi:hypothetical protein
MLRAHPEIEMPNQEMWFFGHPKSLAGKQLYGAVEKWLTLPTVTKEFHNQQPNRLPAKVARAAITSILKTYRTPSTKALGDKSPLFSLRATREIRNIFPEALLIVIYRDGRDVAVSHHFHNLRLHDFRKYADKTEAEAAFKHHIEGGKPAVPLLHRATLEEVCRNWAQANACADAAKDEFGERFFMTSYEELLADPVPFLLRIFSGLGLGADNDLAATIAHSKSFSTVTKGRAPGVKDPKSFYRSGTPGDWRHYFDADSAALFNQLTGDWLIRLGYAGTSDWQTDNPDTPSQPVLRREISPP